MIKHKTNKSVSSEWSDGRLLQTAEAYLKLTDEQFARRIQALSDEGDRAQAETEVVHPPPYILRSVAAGDAKTIAEYAKRRDADFDILTWLRENDGQIL